MLEHYSRSWWLYALRGVLAIAFGLLALLMPGITLLALVLLFAVFAISDGIFNIATGWRAGPDGKRDWWAVVAGVAGIVAGALAVVWPGITALVLLLFIGYWAIFTGILAIIAAYRLRQVLRGEWLLALEGLLSVLFGAFVVILPGAGALAVVWLIGAYAIASGILLLAHAVRLNQREHRRGATQGGASVAR